MASQRPWSLGFLTLLTFFLNFSMSIKVVESMFQYVLLPQGELIMLQKIFAAWNVSTPDIESNLAGWSTFDPKDPNFLNISTTLTPQQAWNINDTNYRDPCFFYPWRGLLCYMKYQEGSNETFWDAAIVGLTLEGASVAGPLPPEIWEFNQLTSLTLTDNPDLKGPIPPFITHSNNSHWTVYIDLHNNGLNDSIPADFGVQLQGLKELGNQFIGALPKSLLNSSNLLTMKMSNNQFTSANNESLEFCLAPMLITIDLSRNNFQEPQPNFRNNVYIHTLNLSHNKFSGIIDMSKFYENASKYMTKFDLSNNNFLGPLPNLGKWTSLKSLNLSHIIFDLETFPTWLGNLNESLEILSLSKTSLIGDINLSIFKYFPNLKLIELDDNFFNGTMDITTLFYSSTNSEMGAKMLQSISMKNNCIANVIFDNSLSLGNLPITFILQGNPYCSSIPKTGRDKWYCFCYQVCNDFPDPDGKHSKRIITITSISSGFTLIILLILTVFMLKSREEKKYLLLAVHKKFAEYDLKPTLFGFNELQKATRDFHAEMKLGEGGFGAVYKGYLGDGSAIAVKQLLTSTKQNMDKFLNEVVLLTSVKHRNLVKLKGCCFSGNRRLLVYEYVENYDLADTIFDHKGDQLLNWPSRYIICLGIAQGLHYLHSLVEPKIIHSDIKASNTLLDKNMQPKIADFGLALMYPNETATHITLVQVAGTKGYLAPEYARLGQLSEKVDVYSFGVLLLEIVSGRRNIDVNAPMDKAYLPDWVWKLNEIGNFMELVDPTISVQTEEEFEVQQVMKIALCCLQMAPERRPTMAQVVAMFQGDMEVGSIDNHGSDRMQHSYQATSRFNTSETVGFPRIDSESKVLYTGPSSSTYSKGTQELELNAIGAR